MNHPIAASYFSKKTIKALAKKNIAIVGIQMIPGAGQMPWANAERAYVISENECGRVVSFADVLQIAELA